MPLTKLGARVLADFKKRYGADEGERRFYASLNSKRLDASKMEQKSGEVRKRQGK
jgi:hypothetical protein